MQQQKTNFDLVSDMNEAFGNPKGNPAKIDTQRLRAQMKNVLDEYNEFLEATEKLENCIDSGGEEYYDALNDVRDSIVDIQVFCYGAQHLIGVDANRDMQSVIDGVMTRFCKNEDELEKTKQKFFSKGVTDVYTEGEYPNKILKSGSDQPDAPKGKFLKSVGYSEPVFYDVEH